MLENAFLGLWNLLWTITGPAGQWNKKLRSNPGMINLQHNAIFRFFFYVCHVNKSVSISCQLFTQFKKPVPEPVAGKTDGSTKYGRGRDWNVDLIPKFILAGGKFNEFS